MMANNDINMYSSGTSLMDSASVYAAPISGVEAEMMRMQAMISALEADLIDTQIRVDMLEAAEISRKEARTYNVKDYA